MSEKRTSIVWALLAAALYAISSPVSKLLLQEVEPTMMAALLYLGAGFGMLLLGIVRLSEIAYKWPDSQGLCPGITAGNSPVC